MSYLIVFLGAGMGGMARHLVNIFAMNFAHPTYVGTAAINISGSFIMGLVAEYFALRGHLSPVWRLFLATGVLGGYTTFSAFSLETVLLYERGQLVSALTYVFASVLLSLATLFAALVVSRMLLRT